MRLSLGVCVGLPDLVWGCPSDWMRSNLWSNLRDELCGRFGVGLGVSLEINLWVSLGDSLRDGLMGRLQTDRFGGVEERRG